MSDDDVFMIATAFGDVAELGQGYINRADGERILVPLPIECPIGEGVRFIVHLGDGTPAFAGAGRCVQVSDQGDGADPQERYETLLDSLAFDERSQPVYDYVVAVRQAVYAAGGPGAEAATEEGAAAEQEAAAEEAYAADAEPASQETVEIEASASVETYEAEPAPEPAPDDLAAYVQRSESLSPPEGEPEAPVAIRSDAPYGMPSEPPAAMRSEAPAEAYAEAPVAARSVIPAMYIPEAAPVPELEPEAPVADPAAFVIAPLPSGMLQRPTLATHWQPAAPRFPEPSPRTGLFRYPAGPLPVPQMPPHPPIQSASRVSRAPAPMR